MESIYESRELLTAEETERLYSLLHSDNPEESRYARNMFVKGTMPLIHKLAYKYSSLSSKDEQVQNGIWGVYKAIGSYKYYPGSIFANYAFFFIRDEMLKDYKHSKKETATSEEEILSLATDSSDYNEIYTQELATIISREINRLSEFEAFVIRKRFGLDDGEPMTLHTLKNTYDLNCSQEKIRYTEKKALKKLKSCPDLKVFWDSYEFEI